MNQGDGESASTVSQLTFPASQKSKDLNKVPLLLQDLGSSNIEKRLSTNFLNTEVNYILRNFYFYANFSFNYHQKSSKLWRFFDLGWIWRQISNT